MASFWSSPSTPNSSHWKTLPVWTRLKTWASSPNVTQPSRNARAGSTRCGFAERNGLHRNYYKQISKLSSLPLNHSELNLISYDGNRMPFQNNKFDVVVSTAVLEHVFNLEGFFQELSRITKPGGLSYHLYHNYYSFSGSHLQESSCKKHPWGHLRGIYKTDTASLNKATIEQISKSFSSEFIMDDIYQVSKDHSKKGIDKTFTYEGQNWLTENIRNELKQYTDEQLLTRSYLIIGRKQA